MMTAAKEERSVAELLATYFNTYREHPITVKALMRVLKLADSRNSAVYCGLRAAVSRHPDWMELKTVSQGKSRWNSYKSLEDKWTPDDFMAKNDPQARKVWQRSYRRRVAERERAKSGEQPSPKETGILSRLKEAELMADAALKRVAKLEKKVEHLERLLS